MKLFLAIVLFALVLAAPVSSLAADLAGGGGPVCEVVPKPLAELPPKALEAGSAAAMQVLLARYQDVAGCGPGSSRWDWASEKDIESEKQKIYASLKSFAWPGGLPGAILDANLERLTLMGSAYPCLPSLRVLLSDEELALFIEKTVAELFKTEDELKGMYFQNMLALLVREYAALPGEEFTKAVAPGAPVDRLKNAIYPVYKDLTLASKPRYHLDPGQYLFHGSQLGDRRALEVASAILKEFLKAPLKYTSASSFEQLITVQDAVHAVSWPKRFDDALKPQANALVEALKKLQETDPKFAGLLKGPEL